MARFSASAGCESDVIYAAQNATSCRAFYWRQTAANVTTSKQN